jgi:hypothetical protein
VPVRVFGRYQLTKALPYQFNRWILWKRNATLEPLYHLDTPAHERKTKGRAGEEKEKTKGVSTGVETKNGTATNGIRD